MLLRVLKRLCYFGFDYEMMRKLLIFEYDWWDFWMSFLFWSWEMKYYYDDVRFRYCEDDYLIGWIELKILEYRFFCLSGILSKIFDYVVKDVLYREFKKFGEFNVNIIYIGEMCVVYINFCYFEDVWEVKYVKYNKLVLFERFVVIEFVYFKKYYGVFSGVMFILSYVCLNEFLNYLGGSSSRRSLFFF